MSGKKFLLFWVLAMGSAAPAFAQIDSVRRIDWSHAGAAGGVQTRNTVCSTLNPGASASQINSAISACPSGQVVKLNAGTYNLSSGIVFNGKKNVTLRGAGPDQTFLMFNGDDGCVGLGADVCVKDASGGVNPQSPRQSANWTAGYAKGTQTITLSNTTNLAVGSIILLDQLNDSNSDNGSIWQCENVNVCATEGASGLARSNRSQLQAAVVTAINGSSVTLGAGLSMPNWRSSQSPGAWWGPDQTYGVGIEDMSMNHANSGAYAGIFFSYARDSWVRNVRSLNSNRAHVWFYASARNTIRDSYFYGTLNAQSQSYGIETDMSSDLLVENNIFQHVTSGMPTGEATSGSVYGYNYSIDDYYTNQFWLQASSYHHSAGINYTLFEGNDGIGFTADAIHGTAHFMTAFRNNWAGWESGKTLQTNAVNVYAFNRYFNFVGNVLGRSGFHTNYECSATSGSGSCGSGSSVSIYMLGWSGNEERFSTVANDPLVKTTMMRWGNFDVVTNGSRFNAAEVPSGLSQYGNAVPGNQTLPASLYLGGRPSWWGSASWPAIGPDVTGGPLMSGRVQKIAARVCYENTSKTGGILNFNANTCYGTGSGGGTPAPAAPSNVRIIQ